MKKYNSKKSKLIIAVDASLRSAMEQISLNMHRIVFVVDSFGALVGTLSDGDIRSFLLQNSIDLSSTKVESAYNRDYFAVNENTIDNKPPKHVDIYPILDKRKRIIRFVFLNKNDFSIGNWKANEINPYIISEIGNNHNGDLNLAKKLIKESKSSGANAVKFQMRVLSETYRKNMPGISEDLGVEYTKKLLYKYNLSIDQLYKCFDEAKLLGLDVICTPFDQTSLIALNDYGVDAIKISSSDFTNLNFLKNCIETGIPLIISSGMSNEDEVNQSIKYLESMKADYCLLHCNSTYPAPFKDLNLKYIERLRSLTNGRPIGYSGHERGFDAVIAAYTLGACIIEKHFTFDKSLEGNDHKVSLLPSEFKEMCAAIRNVSLAIGSSGPRAMTQGEMINRENLSKSLVFSKNMKSGEILKAEDIDIKSPGRGIAPYRLKEFIGLEIRRNIYKHDFIEENCFNSHLTSNWSVYKFNKNFGIPVRFHDIELLRKRNLTLAEFHLSYSDLFVDIENIEIDSSIKSITVHSPEIFMGDDLIDLAANEPGYREKSIGYLRQVKDMALRLKKLLRIKKPVPIIVNVGGFTRDQFSTNEERNLGYQYVHEAFSQLDEDGIEFIAQTMPPFPWLFGGQMHHNLFVNPDEIKKFCETYGRRICFDTSHTFLSCNFLDISFFEACEKLSEYTAHLHISDGKGMDEEGLKIGAGNIDFNIALNYFNKNPDVSFIPEVWQGHKNFGEQFFKDLDELSRLGVFQFEKI